MPIQDIVNSTAAGRTYLYSLLFDPSITPCSAYGGTLAIGVGVNPAVVGKLWQKQSTGLGTDWNLVNTGALLVQGTWDANANLPNLQTPNPPQGFFWIVNTAGNTNLGGITDWQINDWAVSLGGGNWAKIDNSDLVVSVNGISPVSGNVSLGSDDIPNESGVAGLSVSDALDTLAAGSGAGAPTVWYDLQPANGKVLPLAQPRAYYPSVLYNAVPTFFDGTNLRKYVAYYGAAASAQGYAAFSDDGISWDTETLVTGITGLGYHTSAILIAGTIHFFYWNTTVSIYTPGATRHATFNPLVSCTAAVSDAALTGNYTTGVFADGLRYGTYGPSQVFYNPAPTNNPANPYSYQWCMIHDGTTGSAEGLLFATSPDGYAFSAWNGTTEVISRGDPLPQKGTLISEPFTFNDGAAHKLFTIPLNSRIISCKIEITTPFNDATATLTVGTLATANKYMQTTENIPSTVDEYVANPYDLLTANTDIYLTVVKAAATAGAGVIIIEYAPVLPTGWDSHSIGRMNTIIDANGLWHAYYSGGLGTGAGGADTNFGDGIGYATSLDGITWTKFRNNPILFKTESKKGWLRTYTPWLIQDASGYKMYISFKSNTGTYVTGLVAVGGFY